MVSALNPQVTKDSVVEEFRRRGIREAAMRVVGRRGLAHATVQEIADEAGVAKGTVYLYFRSRQEIFERTMQAAAEELLDRIRSAVERDGPFREVLERVFTTQLGYFDEHQDFFRLYFAATEGTEAERRRRAANRGRHIAQLVGMLEAAARRGEIHTGDPERSAVALAGAAREVILRRISERPPRPLAEDVRALCDIFCRGLAVDHPGHSIRVLRPAGSRPQRGTSRR